MSQIGNKAIMAKNIQRLMEKMGKDRMTVCADLGFKYSTFSEWVTGTKYPRIDKIELMADYFGVTKSDLIEEYNPSTAAHSRPTARGVRIPVLGYVRAGLPLEAVEDILDYEEIPEQLADRGEYFGLRINGNSMEPRLYDGDTIIVRQQEDVESGDIAVVLVNGDDATVKRFIKHSGGIVLQALNPAYEPLFFSAAEIEELPVRVIGRVIEVRGKL